MGDLTGKYFAKVMFLRGYRWLSKYENIDSRIVRYVVEDQSRDIKKLKQKFNDIEFTLKKGRTK
jgi:hypothetical protein